MKRRWTEAEQATLRQHYADTRTAELAALLGRSERSVYLAANALGLKKSEAYLKSPAGNYFIRNPRIGQATAFKPGHATWNKGRHYQAGGRSRETQFKPGHQPHTWQPVGHERIGKGGYLQRKISDTGNTQADYALVHHLVWLAAGRSIPPGHALTFRDGDKRNFALDNLVLLTREALMQRNSYHHYPEAIARAIQLRGALNRKIKRLTKDTQA